MQTVCRMLDTCSQVQTYRAPANSNRMPPGAQDKKSGGDAPESGGRKSHQDAATQTANPSARAPAPRALAGDRGTPLSIGEWPWESPRGQKTSFYSFAARFTT